MNRVLIDSAFGSYVAGRKPTAIGNAFLYDEPSLLLWVDEIVCDALALDGERRFASDGWLASELFIRLADQGVVVAGSFEPIFRGDIVDILRSASERDRDKAQEAGLAPTSTIQPERLADRGHNGFYDINAMLVLSHLLGCPYLDVKQTNGYYAWKVKRATRVDGLRPRAVLRRV